MSFNRPAQGWHYNRITSHRGEMLREEFLLPLGMSAATLAVRLNLPRSRVYAILKEKSPITAEIALRLARLFNMSVEFWLNLQQTHDLTKAQQLSGKKIGREVTPLARPTAA